MKVGGIAVVNNHSVAIALGRYLQVVRLPQINKKGMTTASAIMVGLGTPSSPYAWRENSFTYIGDTPLIKALFGVK